jgi:hypothetical protein
MVLTEVVPHPGQACPFSHPEGASELRGLGGHGGKMLLQWLPLVSCQVAACRIRDRSSVDATSWHRVTYPSGLWPRTCGRQDSTP